MPAFKLYIRQEKTKPKKKPGGGYELVPDGTYHIIAEGANGHDWPLFKNKDWDKVKLQRNYLMELFGVDHCPLINP